MYDRSSLAHGSSRFPPAGGDVRTGRPAGRRPRCASAERCGLGDHTSTFFGALRRSGDRTPRVQVSSVIGSVQQSVVDAGGGPGSPLENARITDWYPPASDRRWDTMKAVIRKYAFGDDDLDTADPGAETTSIAYDVFTQVARAVGRRGPIDADTARRGLNATSGLSTGGLTPDLGWTDADMLATPEHPRMSNPTVVYQEVRDGRLVQARPGFVNLTTTLRPPSDPGIR